MKFVKISKEDLVDRGVSGLPDQPGLSTLEMQKKFDELSVDVIIPKFNELSGELDAVLFPTYSLAHIMEQEGWTTTDISKKSTIDIAGIMGAGTRTLFPFSASECITADIKDEIGTGTGVCEIVKFSNERISVEVLFASDNTTDTPKKYYKMVSGSNDISFDRCITEKDFSVEGDNLIYNWL